MSDLSREILGTWSLLRAELGGQAMPPAAAAQVEIEFDAGGGYRVRFAGEVSDSGRFSLHSEETTAETVNATLHSTTAETVTASEASRSVDSRGGPTSQHRLTLYGKLGGNAQRTLPGIIQLRGDRLRLCLTLEGAQAPTHFHSSPATTHYLASYKRKL